MSGLIMRESFATQQLVYVHPDPVPTGSQLEVGGGETLILTFNGEAQDPMGPGVHSIFSPSYRVVHAYFVLGMAAQISLEGNCDARCAGTGATESVGFRASAQIQAKNAKRLVAQLAEIPLDNFDKGMAALIAKKLGEVVSGEVTAASQRTGSIGEAVVDPAARLLIAQLRTKVVNEGLPLPGLDIVELDNLMVWTEGGAQPVAPAPQPMAAPPQPAAAAPAAGPPTGAPPTPAAKQLYPNGTRVYASWDGQWYPATVVGFSGDKYEVDWEGNDAVAWVAADEIRPA